MKLAFIIDKTQTFQAVAGALYEALARGHECSLFCNFSVSDLGVLLNVSPKISDFPNLKWIQHPDKGWLVQNLASGRKEYDAVIGINLFNKGWKSLYENDHLKNYSLEYCWNEIYNQVNPFNSKTVLLCNTDTSKQIIEDLSSYSFLESHGSPWLEFLSRFSQDGSENRRITFLAPHNSLYIRHDSLGKSVESILTRLRSWCDENRFELILKSRAKYSRNFKDSVRFDRVVSDSDASSHIALYSSSSAVIHFCSSAINELSFLETPYLALAPDFQKQLHPDRIHHPGIQRIHQAYYSGDIFDGIHCDGLSSNEMDSVLITKKLEELLRSKKDWKSFQQSHFPGKHLGASSRIMDRIEEDHVKLKQSSSNNK